MQNAAYYALFLSDDLFAAASLWVILRFAFRKEPVRSPAAYLAFGLLFAANAFLLTPYLAGFLYDFDGWADIVTIALHLGASYLLFKGRRQWKTFLTVIVYDATVEMLYSLAAPYLPDERWTEELFCACIHIIVCALVLTAAKKAAVNVLPEVFSGIPGWIWAVLLLFELTCYYKEFGAAASWYGVLYAVSSAAVLLGVLYLIFRIFLLIRRQNNILEQLNAQRDYGETLRTGDEELRRFRHDYKNHMIVVNALLSAGRTDEARDYLNAINSSVDGVVHRISTGNFVADAIVNNKAVAAAKIGARVEFSGAVPARGITDEDLCTILANLLDNALEAVRKPTGEGRLIRVSAGVNGDSFFLKITNPTSAADKKGSFTTTKQDRVNHGIGLKNVKRTVAAYSGNLETKIENGEFIAELMMTMK